MFFLSDWQIDWEERSRKHKKIADLTNALLTELKSESPRYFSKMLYGDHGILFDDLSSICFYESKELDRAPPKIDPLIWEQFYENLAGPLGYSQLLWFF